MRHTLAIITKQKRQLQASLGSNCLDGITVMPAASAASLASSPQGCDLPTSPLACAGPVEILIRRSRGLQRGHAFAPQGEDEEGETDELVNSVLDEIGIDLNGLMVPAPGQQTAVAEVPQVSRCSDACCAA